jgi:energy-coupling factor transporter ATP-binding protein EcfA2
VECSLRESFRVRQVAGMFDLPGDAGRRSSFTVEVPSAEEAWNIGVIVGPSGSGKTTVARKAFAGKLVERWNWPTDRSLLDAFPEQLGIGQITQLLSRVGFSSPPAWLRPYHLLSNGEQFRVHLARTLAENLEIAVVDEFTSVVDRTVAKIGSSAVARAVRLLGRRLVAVTCHYDVLPWLEADWVLDMADGSLSRRRLRRPDVELEIIRCHSSAWRFFSRHHYLSAGLHPSAQCFAGRMDGQPAAFVAALPFPHARAAGWREHRCVCLPDFQGLGIGNAMSEFVGSLFAATGRPYTSVTSHPGMIRHRARSGNWRMIRAPSRKRPGDGSAERLRHMDDTSSYKRMTASFRYVGAARAEMAARFGVL